MRRTLGLGLGLVAMAAGACSGANDPVYLDPMPKALEFVPGQMMQAGPAFASIVVPVHVETTDEMNARIALAMTLGLMPDQVPRVKKGDRDLEIEYTVKNLDATPGFATVTAIGANQYWRYNPLLFVPPSPPGAEKPPPPPPLVGGIPIMVPANGQVSAVFREDELAEAAQDLDAITRAGVVPEHALLTRWDSDDITGGMGGELPMIPGAAVAGILQLDVAFTADTHMVMEYVLRVRDHTDRLRPVDDGSAIEAPSTTDFTPVFPPPMP